MEFFAIASWETRDRLASLLPNEVDVSARLLDMIRASAPSELPALLHALALHPSSEPSSRTTLLNAIDCDMAGTGADVDIAWTWLGAWLAHCSLPDEFASPFCNQKVAGAFCSSFLASELARVTAVSARPNITSFFLAPAVRQLSQAWQPTGDDRRAFGVAIARLVYGTAPHVVTSPVGLALAEACLTLGPEAWAAFQAEAETCAIVCEGQAQGLPLISLPSKTFASGIVIEELSQSMQNHDRANCWNEPAEARHHRMYALVGRLTNGLELEESARILIALSSDTDLFLRCAAVRHAFAATVQCGTLSKRRAHNIRAAVRDCVQRSFSKGAHHWLKAATIAAHCDAVAARASRPIEERWAAPAIGTLDLHQELLSRSVKHPPGLAVQVDRFHKKHKRIALVLPSIEANLVTASNDEWQQANKGSPPLGLGQIATHLASQGHLVRLYDAHRFRCDQARLARELHLFDVVGISVVFSTLRSTATLIASIRDFGDRTAPTVVVGGHAPTLMTARRLIEAGISFDYLIVGPGEEAFEYLIGKIQIDHNHNTGPRIVDSTASLPLSDFAMTNNRELARVRSSASSKYQNFIEQLAWTDRAFFANPASGVAYEPSVTRNGSDKEAHVVLSRGCDWRCSFCTEALIAGKHGENRRSVDDVIGEIEHLAQVYAVNRIQFIDDNVLPTLPGYKRSVRDRVTISRAWAEDFLDALCRRNECSTDQPALRWRGLMRIEDFFFYETIIPDFVGRLSASGCNLLAFGLECGNEVTRSKMKGSEDFAATNADIKRLIARLRAAGIFVKGYFIIGGPHQTKADAEETIEFSVSSDLDLAYFAIYKDFRRIAQSAGHELDAAAIDFKIFSATVLDATAGDFSDLQWEHNFGLEIQREKRPVHAAALRKLHDQGFSFGDLVRYNDYHEWLEPYAKMGFSNHNAYFQTLGAAYLRFYARPEWSDRYLALIHSGY